MNDIERVEGRLFKHYSIISNASRLTQNQISHFLSLKSLPKFPTSTTIGDFEKALFCSGGRLSYAFEEFDENVSGDLSLAAYQFSKVYAGRISLMERFMREKAVSEKRSTAVRLSEMANQCVRDIENSRVRGYEAGQTRGVLTGVRQAIEHMVEHSTGEQSDKYGPLLIADIENWLEDAEITCSESVGVVESLILFMVETFTDRMRKARRSDYTLSNSSLTL
ncbi:hypothetical protein ACYPKM_04525 [Pseudomonas aeruginosa]